MFTYEALGGVSAVDKQSIAYEFRDWVRLIKKNFKN